MNAPRLTDMKRFARPPHAWLALGTVLLTAAACQPEFRFSDDIDHEFNLGSDDLYDDDLATPYVAGARFNIRVYDRKGEEENLTGWELRTDVDGVIEIEDQFIESDDIDEDDRSRSETDVLVANVHAVGEGTVVLQLFDDRGDYVRGTEVEVVQPNEVTLRAAGPLFIRDEDRVSSDVDETPQLLADGTATFLVTWYRDGERLHGSGALSLGSDSDQIVDLWARERVLEEDRDWMTVTAATGDLIDGNLAPVDLYANGELVDTVDFEVVRDTDIDHLEIEGRSEAGAKDGRWLVVLAQAFDVDDEHVWGVGFDWDLNGVPEPGEGDLFRYSFKKGEWSTLAANFGELRAEGQIQGEEGFVADSNTLGCFCAIDEGDRPGRGLAFGLLALGSLALVRRRRS